MVLNIISWNDIYGFGLASPWKGWRRFEIHKEFKGTLWVWYRVADALVVILFSNVWNGNFFYVYASALKASLYNI